MSKTSYAMRYRKAVLEIDEYFRKKHSNGTRVQTSALELENEPSIETMNRTTISGALAALSRIQGSGFRHVKGGPQGIYEFRMPDHYPQELQDLRDQARATAPGQRGPDKTPRRGNLTFDVMQWWRENSDEERSSLECAGDLDALPGSVHGICRRLVADGWLEPRPNIGRGIYIRRSNGKAEAAVEETEAPEAEIKLTVREVEQVEKAQAEPVLPIDPTASPKEVAAKVDRRRFQDEATHLLEQLRLVEPEVSIDKLYLAVKTTKSGRTMVLHLGEERDYYLLEEI